MTSPVGQCIHTNSPIGCHSTYRMAVQGPEAHSSLDTDVWGHFLALSFSSVFSSYPDFPVGLGQFPVLLPPPQFFVHWLRRLILLLPGVSPPFPCRLPVLDTALIISSNGHMYRFGQVSSPL